ncbi:arginine-tRNA-protein transferase [Litorivivens lipolytica]|uniref:Aspartate/glutamate leucyltransferase n=1 Tax=Litorivivens lipolytica TaxID=1524264 RepID=A0A7W4W2U1_9GAMM|nr:arginyltransferase [Litorivivens lipolytica]MBB3046401.1 arginine-tRNA-protein transferase [Litorivivens lipolytica]
MASLEEIKLFQTRPHPCSYLEDQQAVTIFIDPEASVDRSLYSQLSRQGFRRSGEHLYRPHCAQCSQCILTRIPVDQFEPNRSQRRNFKRNGDLRVEVSTQPDMALDYPLYERYITERHRDGDMFPPSQEQFRGFLSAEWGVTRFARFYEGETLIAVAVFDLLDDGLSAVYTFFDPSRDQRGLGKFAILWQVEYARSENLQHVYLGYWIKNCDKMNYKIQYRPLQLLIDQRWLTLR